VHRLADNENGGDGNAGSTRVAVDGAPGQGEVLIDGQWRTALAAGMGGSARGLFALEITDPARDPAALWEFTEHDDAAMGYVQAPPLFVKLRWRAGAGASALPAYRYFVLTSNGVNPGDGNADGILFLLALDKPPAEPWRHGDNYYRLRARARDPDAVNALAAPVLAINSDGSAIYAYAGDLQGAMWRFNLQDIASAASDGELLFRAQAADGTDQPIAEAAQVVFAPGGGYLVLFGTGRAIDSADFAAASFTQQSFYAVRDIGVQPIARVSGRQALVERKLTGLGGADGLRIAGSRFDYNGAGKAVRHGWFFDYTRSLQEGERTATAPFLAGLAVVVTSVAPGADHCAPTMRSYVLDSLTGVPHERRGLPALGYLNGDGGGGVTGRAFVSRDGSVPLLLMTRAAPADPAAAPRISPTGASSALSGIRLMQFSANGDASLLDSVVVSRPAGRLSWREIANWTELHQAAMPGQGH
jgi:type IV pilus assembly protein PilY1